MVFSFRMHPKAQMTPPSEFSPGVSMPRPSRRPRMTPFAIIITAMVVFLAAEIVFFTLAAIAEKIL